jgi:hypothetical protein
VQPPPRKPRYQRDKRQFSVGTSDVTILGSNPRRRAILIGSPLPTDTPFLSDGTQTKGADTSTTGVKSSYTVPAATQATLLAAAMNETTGSTVVAALEWKRGANVYTLQSFTATGQWTAQLDLQAGDLIQWDVTTAVALSITDFVIAIRKERVPIRLTIQFGDAAVAEQGITLSPGTLPLYLHEDHIGSAIQEEVHAITNGATVTVPVVDIFEG